MLILYVKHTDDSNMENYLRAGKDRLFTQSSAVTSIKSSFIW